MKILQLIQRPQLRGAEIFTSQLSNHLQTLNHEIVMVSLFAGTTNLPFAGKQVHLKLKPINRWLDFVGYRSIARLVHREKPDVVQANSGDTLKYAVLSKIVFRWKVPIVFRNASMVSLYIKNPLVKALNSLLYQKISAVVSVSEASRRDINKLFPHTKYKSIVIPVGIEKVEVSLLRRNHYPHFIHVGGFSFEKNHLGLIRIYKNLLEKYPMAHLSLVGDGPLRSEIEKIVKEMQINDKVTFHGYKDDQLSRIASSNILLLPSIIEGFPAVILESFYCKTPVVAFNVGGISELITENFSGKLVPLNDKNRFVSSVIQLLENKSQTKQIINNAYSLVLEKYTNEQIAQRFSEFYTRFK